MNRDLHAFLWIHGTALAAGVFGLFVLACVSHIWPGFPDLIGAFFGVVGWAIGFCIALYVYCRINFPLA